MSAAAVIAHSVRRFTGVLFSATLVVAMVLPSATAVRAQERGRRSTEGAPVDEVEPATMAKRPANTLSDMVNIPFQFNWINGVGPEKDPRQVINIQPVMPLSLTARWDLIGRVVMPFISRPYARDSAFGVGDIVASALFSPTLGSHGVIWGVGPEMRLPTTTDPMLRTGTWAAGPVVVVMKQQGAVTVGALVNQLWSLADTGTGPHADVNQMLLQPGVSYVARSGVTLTLMSEMTVNWSAPVNGDKLTIPVLGMVSKILLLGPLPVALQAGGGVFVAKAEGGPSWQLRTGFVVILPRAR